MINQDKSQSSLPFFSDFLQLKHTFNFSQATLMKTIHGKKSRRQQETI